ncbi:MAG: asparagine synthase (glutamine-hydrolyzing) [Chloroflexi bacterium]|nr:asparagine synthase (glutamine-hydrolyzing) [Chloroflexota bacterium]
MCGIAGILLKGTTALDLRAPLLKMQEAMAHRGPDDTGLYVNPDGKLGLVNRRLSIIDLSPAGHQPMPNEDGAFWVVHNGEVYNFLRLRDRLQQKGHTFRSRSDTEVIVHAYEEEGPQCVAGMRGMFAFAVWNERAKSLFLARDRFGIKPLYYYEDGNIFAFASEVRALLLSGLIEPIVDRVGLQGFLAFGSLPSPYTLIHGVRALEPGQYLEVEQGKVQARSYWSLSFQEGLITEADSVDRVSACLEESVKAHLVSDVPVGVFLSGGIDSTALVALMRRHHNGPIRTLNISFAESEYDEAHYARLVAQKFGTEHTEHRVGVAEVLGQMDSIVGAMDQPTIDGINTYFVSRLSKETGTVVALSGLGSDELFYGYRTFSNVPRLLALRRVPGASALAGGVSRLLTETEKTRRLRYFLGQRQPLEAAYFSSRGVFSPPEIETLLDKEWASSAEPFQPVEHLQNLTACSFDGGSERNGREVANYVSWLELRAYMHNQLLKDTDVMSMAHSIEVRVPFVDHELAELVASLPIKFKTDGGPKGLLIRAMGPDLPREVVSRRKQGFAFPMAPWLRQEGAGYRKEALSLAQGVLDRDGVDSVWDSFLKGRVSWVRPWALYVLAKWMERWGL